VEITIDARIGEKKSHKRYEDSQNILPTVLDSWYWIGYSLAKHAEKLPAGKVDLE
jgi:hypothetical protein